MTTSDPRTTIRLRFLAEAAITALSNEAAEADAAQGPIPADASENMLRVLLQHSVPVLRASTHQQLADQIEAFLAEPRDPPHGSTVVRSDMLLLGAAVAVLACVVSFFMSLPELLDASDIRQRLIPVPERA